MYKLSGFLLGVLVSAAQCGDDRISVTAGSEGIINQHLYRESPNGCGPSALLNSLKFGDEDLRSSYLDLVGGKDETRLRYVMDRFFRSRPSTVAPSRKRWEHQGVYVKDLAQSCNDLLAERKLRACHSDFLDRREGESDEAQLLRIHEWIVDSLNRGFPPILSLRSFVVRARPENDLEPKWEMVFHHVVVIHSVPASLASGSEGFEATILDSNGGKSSGIYIHPEPYQQPFNVLKGNEIDGVWIKGRPFLLVTAPGVKALRPKNLQWSERFLITANFMIGRF